MKTILPSDQPYLGLKLVAVVVEERLASRNEIRRRVERYADDISRAYGIGVEVISIPSSASIQYLKGMLRDRMPLGLAGAVFVGRVPKAFGEVYEVHVSRDVFLCDMYFMDLNTKALPGNRWSDPGWLDEGRPVFASVARKTAQNIDFDWGENSPAPGIPNDKFSARFTGRITPPVDGLYTFTIRSDNGRRLVVNGRRLIDEWKADWGKDYSGQVHLQRQVPVPITLEYFDDRGGASVRLSWTIPGSQASSTVPASAFSNLRVEYFNNANLSEDAASTGGRCFANNGIFDRVTDGTKNGEAASIMAPDIFVSRIETHTSGLFGDEETLLAHFFDKDHAYWSGSFVLGNRGVVHFGPGSTEAEPIVIDRMARIIDRTQIDVRFNPSGPAQYLEDLANPAYFVSVYCGHGNEDGIGRGIDSRRLLGVNVQPVFVDLESCSPLRTIRASSKHPNGEEVTSYIGGAHLYADSGKGRCLSVKGASKTSGGNQREEFFYGSLAKGNPIGIAFLDWAKERMQSGGDAAEWFDYFYPQVLIGDPLIFVGPAPDRAERPRSK